MAYADYVPVTGTIVSIARTNECCNQMMTLRTDNGIVNFMVNPETIVIDSRQLCVGMRVAAFYDSSLPVPLIYPPQYMAQLVTVLGRNEQIMLNYFDSDLIATDMSLRLFIGRNTVIQTINGQNFTCDIGNQSLLVYYSVTTRSIPPQTTPRKIVVLC